MGSMAAGREPSGPVSDPDFCRDPGELPETARSTPAGRLDSARCSVRALLRGDSPSQARSSRKSSSSASSRRSAATGIDTNAAAAARL